jgi:hypothetical protein
VTAAEDAAEARMPRFPRRPICSPHRCGRSPLPYYCRSLICLSIRTASTILSSWVPARPASERFRRRHEPYESSLHPPSTAERSVTSVWRRTNSASACNRFAGCLQRCSSVRSIEQLSKCLATLPGVDTPVASLWPPSRGEPSEPRLLTL